jgi:2-dehydro-3-deoxyphosphogluconate aldolase/(4S)-4-hydroxy-2-oxoglutarate aldolase
MTDSLYSCGVVPVVAIEDAAHALPLADALIAGGLPVAEITFRTQAGAAVIETLANERPDMLVGAGTVLSPEQAKRAKACGAQFAVAPGLNPDVVRAAFDEDLPFFPGVMTPSDVEAALSLGCRQLKFFPAGPAGGVKMLKALTAPYKHMGVKFMPTGGVTIDNLSEYLAVESVTAVGGTWIATTEAIRAGDWGGIAERARAAADVVKQVRG